MKAPRHIFYGWFIVGITFLIMSVSYAIWYSFSIFYVPILTEFGWTRAETALIFSIGSLVYGFGSAIAGVLLDRFGPRKTFTCAALIMAIGLVGCSRVSEIWQFFLFWSVFVSFGVCTAGYVPCVALVSNWFIKRRATAVGIAQAGGRESFVMTPVIQSLILAVGWQNAYLLLGGAVALLIIIPSQFLKYSPQDVGLLPDGKRVTKEPEKIENKLLDKAIINARWANIDWTLPKALKEYRFWTLFGIMLTLGTGYGIVMTHQVAFMVDIGFTALFASFTLLIYGIASMLGRFCGFASDIFGREAAFTFGCVGIIAGFLLISFTKDSSQVWMLYLYAVCFGFFSGFNSPTYAASVADMFAGKHFGSILGFANIGYGLGNSLGSWIAGYIFDITRNYSLAFSLAILVLILSCMFIWISSPRKIRQVNGKVSKMIVA